MKTNRLRQKINGIATRARAASLRLHLVSETEINAALRQMARALFVHRDEIIAANRKDLLAAKKKKLASAFVDRLTLDDKRIQQMSDGLMQVSRLSSPVGQVIDAWDRPNGMKIERVRVPIGSILIIYESRPNVTADCIGLCLKSANAVILRGGSDALHSNKAIYSILQDVAKKNGIPGGSIQLVDIPDRKAIDVLLKCDDTIDLVIPRGGEGLIREVKKKSLIPVIVHYKGICHVYVDAHADLNMAERIVFNAKVQRPGVCNAMETLLVHRDVAVRFLPGMAKKLQEAGCEIRGCPVTRKILRHFKKIKSASQKDWSAEYLSLIVSLKVVDSLTQAIEHINRYGSHHTDSIVTDDERAAERFLKEIDSASVFRNISTRFSDGYEFGLGAEIGISTDKLHARGPMALQELTIYKFVVRGAGQIRQ